MINAGREEADRQGGGEEKDGTKRYDYGTTARAILTCSTNALQRCDKRSPVLYTTVALPS